MDTKQQYKQAHSLARKCGASRNPYTYNEIRAYNLRPKYGIPLSASVMHCYTNRRNLQDSKYLFALLCLYNRAEDTYREIIKVYGYDSSIAESARSMVDDQYRAYYEFAASTGGLLSIDESSHIVELSHKSWLNTLK